MTFGFPVAHENDAERVVEAGPRWCGPCARDLRRRRVARRRPRRRASWRCSLDLHEDDIYGLAAHVGRGCTRSPIRDGLRQLSPTRSGNWSTATSRSRPPRRRRSRGSPIRCNPFMVVGERSVPARRAWSARMVDGEAELGQRRDGRGRPPTTLIARRRPRPRRGRRRQVAPRGMLADEARCRGARDLQARRSTSTRACTRSAGSSRPLWHCRYAGVAERSQVPDEVSSPSSSWSRPRSSPYGAGPSASTRAPATARPPPEFTARGAGHRGGAQLRHRVRGGPAAIVIAEQRAPFRRANAGTAGRPGADPRARADAWSSVFARPGSRAPGSRRAPAVL